MNYTLKEWITSPTSLKSNWLFPSPLSTVIENFCKILTFQVILLTVKLITSPTAVTRSKTQWPDHIWEQYLIPPETHCSNRKNPDLVLVQFQLICLACSHILMHSCGCRQFLCRFGMWQRCATCTWWSGKAWRHQRPTVSKENLQQWCLGERQTPEE